MTRMTKLPFIKHLLAPGRRGRNLTLAAGGVVLLLAAISCSTVSHEAVMLPDVPGAKYIGSSECEQCHEEIYRDFKTADHSRLIALGTNSMNVGCESCHGPCSLHSDSGGETKPPFSFTAGRPQPASLATLPGMPPARAKETVCYQCHNNVRGQFQLPSHHPVPEGRMSCTVCHSPHKGSVRAGGGTALLSQDENCLQCHPAQRGPYVFAHEAMSEGCTTCHTAHGSVNAKMLTVRDSNLCLKCHFQQQVPNGTTVNLLIGGKDHTLSLQQGACWSAGCHEAVHGSRVSPSLRF
jgi:predicted CXXCH cytochrome family protein